MSVADRLTKLTTDITNAYTSIENKGGTIPANKNTNNLPTAIDSIEVIEQATAEGESLSLTNTKAMPYSDYIVEGKSEQETGKSKNFFNTSNISSDVTDYTITIQDGGFIIRTGAMINGLSLGLLKDLCPELKVGDKFKFTWDSNATRNNSDVTYIYLNLYANTIRKDITYTCTQEMLDSNTFFYGQQGEYYKNIMFYLDGQTSDYEPYGEKPSPSIPSEIHSVADDINLFDTYNYLKNSAIVEQNGMKMIRNGDGTLTLNGTTTQLTTFGLFGGFNNTDIVIPLNNNKSYTSALNSSVTSPSFTTYVRSMENGSLVSRVSSTTSNSTFSGSTGLTNFVIQIPANTTLNNVVVKPKIQKGTVATPYSPYNQGTVTIKQRGTTESNDYIIQTEPLRSLPNGVKDTIEAEQHRKIGRQTGTLTETTTITLSDAKTNGAYMCNIKPSGTLTGKTIELEAGDYEIIYELETEIIEPLTQNQATTMLDIIKTGSYDGTTNIYTDEDVKPTMKAGYYKKG